MTYSSIQCSNRMEVNMKNQILFWIIKQRKSSVTCNISFNHVDSISIKSSNNSINTKMANWIHKNSTSYCLPLIPVWLSMRPNTCSQLLILQRMEKFHLTNSLFYSTHGISAISMTLELMWLLTLRKSLRTIIFHWSRFSRISIAIDKAHWTCKNSRNWFESLLLRWRTTKSLLFSRNSIKMETELSHLKNSIVLSLTALTKTASSILKLKRQRN